MSVALETNESLYPFVLTEEQEALRREIREFAAREIAPNVMKWDEVSEFPLEVVKKLGQMGLLGIIFPPEYGGAGLGYVDYVLAIEELASVDGSIGIIVAAHNSLGTNHIFLAGNEAQKRKYVSKLATGEWLAAWGLTEPGAGSDASNSRTTATKKGDRYILNGNKTFITNGHYADVAVVIASTDKSKGTHGLSAFVVEKGTKGFRPGKKENKLGLRASDTSELIFEDCEIPEENLLGAEGEGFIDAMRVLDGGPHLDRGAGAGDRTRCVGCSLEIREGAQAIRQGDCRVSRHSMEAGRHGNRVGRRSPADPAGRSAEGCGAQGDARIINGQVVFERGGGAHLRRCRAALWRVWIHQGLSRREVLSRREALHHRRRHQRDSTHGDRKGDSQGLSVARLVRQIRFDRCQVI